MSHERTQFLAGVRVTGLWTLASRALGMLRDVATAALLGLAAGGVMDAFVIAFRIPNLFRRLFGEGALAASYLPVLTGQLEKDRPAAFQLVSVLLTWLAVILCGIVILCELICAGIWAVAGSDPRVSLVVGLTAVLLPYLLFICLAAQVAATLQALNQFSVPAFVPILLNVAWIAGALLIAPHWSEDKEIQACILAVCILIGGVLQLTFQFPVLWRLGFRYDYNWPASRKAIRRVVTSLLPMLIGLAITQINTLLDSLIAWGFSSPVPDMPIGWLRSGMVYPMREGAAAAIYYGERLYQLPIGLLGMAVATVIFPLLSRHAARGDRTHLADDLTLGLRLVLFLAIPATAGLVLLAEPLTRLLFQRGEFTAADSARTSLMIATYGLGVWAYCALPVLVRGFYALDDYSAPVRIGVTVVGLNLLLNMTLIWILAEAGLALATAISASVQAVLLAIVLSRRWTPLDWRGLAATLMRSVLATGVMTVAGWLILRSIPAGDPWWLQALRVLFPLAGCVLVYLATFAAIGGSEWRLLAGRRIREK